MTGSNRSIEEKLAIVQQLKQNVSVHTPSDLSKASRNTTPIDTEERSLYLTFLMIRLGICILLFGLFVWTSSVNPHIKDYIDMVIVTEENGKLIDFMKPFTYTLQESNKNIQSGSL